MDCDAGNNDSEEYKVETIQDSAVHAKELELGHLPGLYYLVFWKSYPKEENTWEPYSAVQHLRKLISSFHKDYPDKPTTTFEVINIKLPIAKPTTKPITTAKLIKQKRGQLANSVNNRAKKN